MTTILIIGLVTVFVALVAMTLGGESHNDSAAKDSPTAAKKSGFIIHAASNHNDSKEREVRLMAVLERLIVDGDEAKILEWLQGYYDSGNRVPNKVYARAMTFIEGKDWLSDEEYEVQSEELSKELHKRSELRRKEQERIDKESAIVHRLVAKTVDILLNFEISDEQQIKLIDEALAEYGQDEKFRQGILKFGYWHSMHIIWKSKKTPSDISKKAGSDRQRMMGALTRGKIEALPIFEVKHYLNNSNIRLSSKDRVEYQNFAFVSFNRDFEVPRV